jgi:hypothetical protein
MTNLEPNKNQDNIVCPRNPQGHTWKIDRKIGEKSKAVCVHCSEVREFKNGKQYK